MSYPLEPGGVCRLVCAADAGKPAPPTFLFPFLSARQQRHLMASYTADGAAPMDVDGLFDTLGQLLLGWDNIDQPFDPADLDLVINIRQAFELLNLLIMQAPDSAEKNASGSPSA